MDLRTEFFLAWKYFKPKRNAVSIITLISVIGVGLGVGVLIVVLAVMTGFSAKIREKLLDTTAHAQIRGNYNLCISDPEKVEEEVRKLSGDALPIVVSPILIQKNNRFLPKVMVGFNPGSDKNNIRLKDFISEGEYSLNKGEIVISYVIAREFRVNVGDKILLHSPSNLAKLVSKSDDGKIEVSKNAEMHLPTEFKVTGIFSFGKYDFDKDFMFMNMDDADELLGLPWGSSNCIYVWTKDPFNIEPFMSSLRKRLSDVAPDCRVESWKEINSRLLGVLAVEKNMQFFLLVFIVLVAAFSITNTLITTVIQKTREIGLLKAIGAGSGTVMRIFIMQGFFVGLLGTAFGIVLGFAIVEFRMKILLFLRAVTGQEIFPKEIYLFNELPAQIIMSDIAWIAVISILLCTFGGVIPALRAASLDPARALRYE